MTAAKKKKARPRILFRVEPLASLIRRENFFFGTSIFCWIEPRQFIATGIRHQKKFQVTVQLAKAWDTPAFRKKISARIMDLCAA